MSRFFLLRSLVAVFLLAGTLGAQELSADEQSALITKLQQKRAQMPALTANFTEERTSKLVQKPLVTQGTIAFQAPNKFRQEIAGDAPSTKVCNGADLWIYYPVFKEAEHYTVSQNKSVADMLAALTAGLNFQDVDRYFRVKAAKDGDGHRVTLTPKSSGLRKYVQALTVTLDADGMILKSETTKPEGERVVTTYKNVRAAKQSDAKFDFAAPAGTSVKTPLGK